MERNLFSGSQLLERGWGGTGFFYLKLMMEEFFPEREVFCLNRCPSSKEMVALSPRKGLVN